MNPIYIFIIFAFICISLIIVIFHKLNKNYKKNVNIVIKTELYNILLNNVVKIWDDISFKHREEKLLYQEEKFLKLEKDNEVDLHYYEFIIEDHPEHIKASANYNGFCIHYNEFKKEYYLSLHLGTSNDLRSAILRSLKEKFNNVTTTDGCFVQGFTFF